MQMRLNQAPELLAPAGGPEALLAAVNNGADAVYAGLGTFNARRGAENFTTASLAEGCRLAHLHGVRVYLTANVLVHDDEFDEALGVVSDAWHAGVDAVIVQDLGFAYAVREAIPGVRLHASTQLDAHNSDSIAELAAMGAARVTLARETSLPEIASFLAANPEVEIESFVHGSLCYCYSGQCLFSSVIGGRSANRGMCAQPCRLPYELVDERGHVASRGGRYLLSPKDLAAITVLPDLMAAGVAALKIEGRMKSPEYVALVTATYRSAIDRAAADPEGFEVTPAEWATLEEAFSRGFTEGYLAGVRDERMMSRSRPNNRGVPLGRVASTSGETAVVAFDRAAESDDLVEFWTRDGRFAQRLGPIGTGSTAVPAGTRAPIGVEHRVAAGDRVFRVANASLLAAARRTFESGREPIRPMGVSLRVRVRSGLPLRIEASAKGETGRGEGPRVERARTKAVTAAEVMEHVGRLGGTSWRALDWDLEIDPSAGIEYSALHRARREAIADLESRLLRPWSRPSVPPRASGPPRPADAARRRERPEVVVVAEDLGTLQAALNAGADRGVLDVTSCTDHVRLPERVSPLLPRVAHDEEMDRLLSWVSQGDLVTVGNLGLLGRAIDAGARVEADWPLNALNARTVGVLSTRGIRAVWLSPELAGRELRSMVRGCPVPAGIIVYGRLELMVAEHCALQAVGGCQASCDTCSRRRRRWLLRDQKGYEFPVSADGAGRTHLYNSVTLDLSRALAEIVASGVSALRLDFRIESPAEAARVTHEFVSRLSDALAGRPPAVHPVVSPATSGHYHRGIR